MRRYEPAWYTKAISPTCEVREGDKICGQVTAKAYPANGGGWMALCRAHGLAHPEATLISDLLKQGERMARS